MLGNIRIDKNDVAAQLFALGSEDYTRDGRNYGPLGGERNQAREHASPAAFLTSMIRLRLGIARVARMFDALRHMMVMRLMGKPMLYGRGKCRLLQLHARRPARAHQQTESQKTDQSMPQECHAET
jgi:hypothetical protein